MARKDYLFTSESVSEGHPDKVADQISDAILDAILANDIKLGIADKSAVNTRLGCETLVTTDKVVIAGEGRGQAPLFKVFDSHQHPGSKEARINRELISQIARGVIKDIGYDQVGFSFHGADVEVLAHAHLRVVEAQPAHVRAQPVGNPPSSSGMRRVGDKQLPLAPPPETGMDVEVEDEGRPGPDRSERPTDRRGRRLGTVTPVEQPVRVGILAHRQSPANGSWSGRQCVDHGLEGVWFPA